MKKIIENNVLEKYHRTKELSSILKPTIKSTEETDSTTNEEQQQAQNVLNEIDDQEKQRQKALKKSKKKFKKQKKKLQSKESNPSYNTNNNDNNKEQKCDKALAYLKQWKKHHDEWKFKKNLHIWLFKNWKNDKIFPDKRFKIFLKYLQAQDNRSQALNRIKIEAKQLIDSSSSTTENSVLERAKSILQWLP